MTFCSLIGFMISPRLKVSRSSTRPVFNKFHTRKFAFSSKVRCHHTFSGKQPPTSDQPPIRHPTHQRMAPSRISKALRCAPSSCTRTDSQPYTPADYRNCRTANSCGTN
jgi:hypothetical protein